MDRFVKYGVAHPVACARAPVSHRGLVESREAQRPGNTARTDRSCRLIAHRQFLLHYFLLRVKGDGNHRHVRTRCIGWLELCVAKLGECAAAFGLSRTSDPEALRRADTRAALSVGEFVTVFNSLISASPSTWAVDATAVGARMRPWAIRLEPPESASTRSAPFGSCTRERHLPNGDLPMRPWCAPFMFLPIAMIAAAPVMADDVDLNVLVESKTAGQDVAMEDERERIGLDLAPI